MSRVKAVRWTTVEVTDALQAAFVESVMPCAVGCSVQAGCDDDQRQELCGWAWRLYLEAIAEGEAVTPLLLTGRAIRRLTAGCTLANPAPRTGKAQRVELRYLDPAKLAGIAG